MQPFINRTSQIRQNVIDITTRLRDINNRLVGPQPQTTTEASPKLDPVRPLMAEMDKELGDLYSAVDVLSAEVSRLYSALDLSDERAAGVGAGRYA